MRHRLGSSPDARRAPAGRRLVVGADEAPAAALYRLGAPVQGPHRGSRSSRCSARRPSRWRRRTSSAARSTRCGTARPDELGWLVARLRRRRRARDRLHATRRPIFTGWTGERMLADLRNHLFRHLQRLSLGFYERNRAGVIISRLTNDVEALDQLVTDGVTSLVQNTLTLVGTAVVLFFLDWRLALATLTVMPADGARDRLVPQALRPRLPRRARDARRRHGNARRGHRRHACAAVVHPRDAPRSENFRHVSDPTAARTCRPSS